MNDEGTGQVDGPVLLDWFASEGTFPHGIQDLRLVNPVAPCTAGPALSSGRRNESRRGLEVVLTPMSLYCKLIGVASDEEQPAGDALQQMKNWRSRTRAVRHGYWFPLVMFGLLTLAASPLFWAKDSSPCAHWRVTCTFSVTGGTLGDPFAQSPSNVALGRWVSLYWMLAVPLGYVATVFYYRHRARRTGVAGRVWPAAGVGLALLVLMVGSFESRGWLHLPGHPTWGLPVPILLLQGRGLDPLLVIGIGVGILARLERSRALTVFAGMFFALALLSWRLIKGVSHTGSSRTPFRPARRTRPI